MQNELSSVDVINYGITVTLPYSRAIKGWSSWRVGPSNINDVKTHFHNKLSSESDSILKSQIKRCLFVIQYAQELDGFPNSFEHINDEMLINFSFTKFENFNLFHLSILVSKHSLSSFI